MIEYASFFTLVFGLYSVINSIKLVFEKVLLGFVRVNAK